MDSDSSESDRDLSDDDLSDAEDAHLRRAVRERAAAADDAQRRQRQQTADTTTAPTRTTSTTAAAATTTTTTPGGGDVEEEDDEELLCGDASAGNGDNGGGGGGSGVAPRPVQGVNAGQIGPELAKLRAAQGEHMEYYTIEHYHRLYGRRRPWGRDGRGGKVWCKDVHGPGCDACTSCHFCRQKTSDLKTRCVCGEWRRQPPGGRGRGAWCGWCLEMRMVRW